MKALIIIVTVVSAWAGVASAQKKCTSAVGKELWASGVKAYNLSEYQKAADDWTRAYEHCPDPELLFNLAQANRKLNHHAKARDLYKSWLREVENPDPAERQDVEKKIVDLEKLIAAEKASQDTPPVPINPVPGGPTTPDAVQPVDAAPWYKDTLGWSLVAGGVVTMGVGGGMFVYGGSLRDDADGNPDQGEAADLVDDAGTYRTTGAVLVGVGAAIAVAGGIKLALTDKRAPASRDATNVAFGPGWVVLRGTF